MPNGTTLTAGNNYYTSEAGAGEFTAVGTEVSNGHNYYQLLKGKQLPIGNIGTIYGGGYEADVAGNTYVEIGTGQWLNNEGKLATQTKDASTGVIHTYIYDSSAKNWYDENDHSVTLTTAPTPIRNAAQITGNVFGGGKGIAEESGDDAFTCAKAMVGIVDSGKGSTSVIIENGTVGGNVYGGGEIGRVESNTAVTIGKDGEIADDSKFKPVISGDVFGAGEGVVTHGYSGLVRGNSSVTIQGLAKIGRSVYGGGEKATVGRYWVHDNTSPTGKPAVPEGTPLGYPYANRSGGYCTVVVKDYAEIGPDDMVMINTVTGKPDNTGHVFGASQGAIAEDYTSAKHMTNANTMETRFASEEAYLEFIETLGLTTQADVTIGGHAFVKGDVFGGAEQGFVQHDTHVTIEGDCQIGNGYVQMDEDGKYLDELVPSVTPMAVNRRYTPEEWAAGHLIPNATTEPDLYAKVNGKYYLNSLPECASWKFKSPFAFHDMYAKYENDGKTYYDAECTQDAGGGSITATDGETFYGNVFGGGSGYFPYAAGKWHWKAGNVGGNSVVDIKGGHILTNVYGGNEMTSVAGKCTVNMTKGTIGVPRTLGQIINHPMSCYLFGAGMGDSRVNLNSLNLTNVQEAEVNVSGGWIYGSVFGGAEDGHVLGNATVNISGGVSTSDNPYAEAYAGTVTRIGNWGTSYVDGNVFGGGRGFEGHNAKAGRIGGNVTINITGGEMLGSIYGGGRLGSIGMAADGSFPADVENGDTYGHITINISGGTIGNKHEYVFIDDDDEDDESNVSTIPTSAYRNTGFNDFKSFTLKTLDEPDENDPTMGLITEGKTVNYKRLYHVMGGNIYGGCMGRLTDLDGNVNPIWQTLGICRSTTINVSGSPTIRSSIFGGAEFGKVTGNTNVTINGTPTIGSLIYKSSYTAPQYGFGSVYGGGYGSERVLTDAEKTAGAAEPREYAGIVEGDTYVTMNGGKVRANVYGGGKTAVVNHDTHVTITGGEVGLKKVRKSDGYVMYGSSNQGNVLGAGRGSVQGARIALVKGDTYVNISGGEIYHNVYGGGSLGSVGTFRLAHIDAPKEGDPADPSYIPSGVPFDWTSGGKATITITGGVIGISGRDNGMVFGSSRGDISAVANPGVDVDPYDKVAWINKSVVNIGTSGAGTYATPIITGNVYGGGENGHNSTDSEVNIYSGTVGVVSGPWAIYKDNLGNDDAVKTREVNANRGAVYGGGCGQDYFTLNGKTYYNPKGGMIGGNSYVNVSGGLIARNVYGGGSMASVGTCIGDTASTKNADPTSSFAMSWPYKIQMAANTGVTNVNITGGHIGMGSERIVGLDNGNIYGGSKGTAGHRQAVAHLANVKETHVTVNFAPTSTDLNAMTGSANYAKNSIEGSIFGGGENGHVIDDTHVILQNGFVSHSVFGGGRGEGKYEGKLLKVGTGEGYAGPPASRPEAVETQSKQIFDWLSGKVYGNTHVTIYNGRVYNNVLGGGYMASVGKGNYASGTDDYYPVGYGETLDGPLWDGVSDDSKAFLASGNTFVTVLGGEIGSTALWDELPAGNIFGGSRGMAAPNLRETSRHLYNPEWLNGYVNETHVNIGGYKCTTGYGTGAGAHAKDEVITVADYEALASEDKGNWTLSGPKIYGSVYGGPQDGRVRRDTHVAVYAGEIGLPFTTTYRTELTPDATSLEEALNNAQWLHRGNVYGAGSGISKYHFDANDDGDTNDNGETGISYYGTKLDEEGYSQYAGCVIRYTNVDIKGGTIHRNVYGGGSLASVGPPAIPPTRKETAYKPETTTRDARFVGEPDDPATTVTTIGQGWWSSNTVNIFSTVGSPDPNYNSYYGGEVYGASRGGGRRATPKHRPLGGHGLRTHQR